MRRLTKFWVLAACCLMATACTVQYKFNGASIDYNRIKTLAVQDFPNQAVLVYPPLSQLFTESLKDLFSRQTKLRLIERDAHLALEGEITGYELTPMAAQADGYATETKLTVTVRVRFTNNVDPDESFEQTFSAYRMFDAAYMLEDVQDALLEEINKEIAEAIFNKTVANW
ncbi:MAG TPA: LptE family protein [Bacteroidales bacterium]|nr:LptE family protein [Bacteroidales bacterium]